MAPPAKRMKMTAQNKALVRGVRSALGKRKSGTVAIKKDVKRLKKIMKVENQQRKYTEDLLTVTGVTNTAPQRHLWLGCGQGTQLGQRAANDAYLHTFIASGICHWPERASNHQPQIIRVIAGLIRKDVYLSGTQINAQLMCSQLFNSNTPKVYAQYTPRVNQLTGADGLGDKYIVKYDKLWKQKVGSVYDGTSKLSWPDNKPFKIMMNFKNVHAVWPADLNPASRLSPDTYCPFILFIADHPGAPNIEMEVRQWFTDTSVF